jgi:hypothetical protein
MAVKKLTRNNVGKISPSSDVAKKFYERQSKIIAERIDIAKVISQHNSGLSDDDFAYTHPVDNNRSVGKLEKSGYGLKITVHNNNQRNNVLSKVWNAMGPHLESIRLEYQSYFAMNLMNVVVEDWAFTRNASYSDGANTIYLRAFKYNEDGNIEGSPINLFVIYAKGLTSDKGDPHELMTGTLIAMGKIIPVSNINTMNVADRNEALNKITKEIHSNYTQVIGHSNKEAKLIEGDIVNLAKALSVSNWVNFLMRKNNANVNKVFQTGSKWDAELKRAGLQGKDPTKDQLIKAYNSSDLIIKFTKDSVEYYWGISLKKKSGLNDDPTLLNKPLVGEASASGKQKAGYLYLKAQSNEKNEMKTAEENFWKQVYMVKLGPPPLFPPGKKLGDNVEPTNWPTKPASDWKTKLNNALSGDDKNASLTGKEYRGTKYPNNFFFETLDKVFRRVMSDPNNFREFLDLAFRLDINEYVKNSHFYFSLITGTGSIDKRTGKIVVGKVDEKSTALMKEIFNIMFSSGINSIGNPSAIKKPGAMVLETWNGKSQAFEPTASAAKLYYTMRLDNLPLLNLEVRYKGAITASPQFQVFITTDFKQFYKQIKNKMEVKGIRTVLR